MIAYVGPDIPHDILRATGRCAGPLAFFVDRETPTADQWLENKFPLWCRSIVEDWVAGVFNDLEAVVFSRGDDSAHRLYYYLCELQRQKAVGGPKPLVFDVAKIQRPSSTDATIAAARGLAALLNLDDQALEQGIRESNVDRRSPQSAPESKGRTCLITGSAPPDRRLHSIVQSCDWAAVGRTLPETWSWLGDCVEEATGDPAAAIGRQVHGSATGARGFFDRATRIVEEARAARAAAVVLWYAEEEEAQIWRLPAQRRALETAGIPHLVLTRRDWRANDGVGREIASFLEGLSG